MTGHLNHITKHEAVPDFTNPAIDFAPLIAQQYLRGSGAPINERLRL
jgi:hypothetical protein